MLIYKKVRVEKLFWLVSEFLRVWGLVSRLQGPRVWAFEVRGLVIKVWGFGFRV